MDLKTELVQLREQMREEQETDIRAVSKASAVSAAAQARVDRRIADLNKLDAIINSLSGGPGA